MKDTNPRIWLGSGDNPVPVKDLAVEVCREGHAPVFYICAALGTSMHGTCPVCAIPTPRTAGEPMTEAAPTVFRRIGFATLYDVAQGCRGCRNEVVAAYTETQADIIARLPVCNKHALDMAGDWELHDEYQAVRDAGFAICYPVTFDELTTWILDGEPLVMPSPGFKELKDAD